MHAANSTTSEAESVVHKQYPNDLDTVAKDHAVRTELYNEKTWVLYFISVSLQADHILQTWRNKSVGEGRYDLAEITLLVYNFKSILPHIELYVHEDSELAALPLCERESS